MINWFSSIVVLSLVFSVPDQIFCHRLEDAYYFRAAHTSVFLDAWKNEQIRGPVSVDIDHILKMLTKTSTWLVHLTYYKNINLLPIKQPIVLRGLFPVDVRPSLGNTEDFEPDYL